MIINTKSEYNYNIKQITLLSLHFYLINIILYKYKNVLRSEVFLFFTRNACHGGTVNVLDVLLHSSD